METSGGSDGADSWRADPLAASRLSSSAPLLQRTLVRADSVSRESVVCAASFIERLEGRQRSESSPSSSAVAAAAGGAPARNLTEHDRRLGSALEAAIAEAAHADKAEELVVTLESKAKATEVEAEALRAQLAKLTLTGANRNDP